MDADLSEFRFGRFRLDPMQRRLLVDGAPAKLGARAFDLLIALVERRDRLVPKDELMQIVWPRLVVEENNLQVHIAALRKLLGAQSIATIPAQGYKFTAPVTVLRASTHAVIPAAAGAEAAELAAIPATVLRPPQLVARQGVVRAMEFAWAAGNTLVVAGEAGIGKSRLLSEFATMHAPSIQIAARPGDVVVPFSSLIRLLTAAVKTFAPTVDDVTARECARLLPQLAPATDPAPALASDVQRLRFLASLGDLLKACHAQGCRAFLFDDLQFADEASIDALRVIADPAAPDAPRFVFGARVEDLTTAASAFLNALGATRMTARFELAPLSTHDIEQLLASLNIPGVDAAALSRRLRNHVGGNPAFLLETIKTMLAEGRTGLADDAEVPVAPTLISTVRQRLSQLSADAISLAQLAAVAGPDFSLPLAAAALGRAPLSVAPLLAELERLQILHGSRFAHDLVQDAVRRSTPEAIAQLLHRWVADHLQAHGGDPARIAAHLLGAADERAAAPFLFAAAEQSRARWQLQDAAVAFEHAGRIFGAGGNRARAFEAQMSACRCYGTLQQSDGELRTLSAAHAAAGSPAEQILVQGAEVRRAINLGEGERMTSAAHTLAMQLHDALDIMPAQALAEQLPQLARGLAPVGGTIVLDLIRAIEPRLDPTDLRAALMIAHALGTTHFWSGNRDEAMVASQRALQLARQQNEALLEVRAGRDVGLVLADRGEHDAALAQWDATLATIERGGLGDAWRMETQCLRSWSLRALGRFDEALAILLAPFDYGPYELTRCRHAIFLWDVWTELGQTERAGRTLAAAKPPLAPHSQLAIRWSTASLRLACLRGEPVEDRWSSVWNTWQGNPDGCDALHFRVLRARCQASDGAYDDAVRLAALGADRGLLSIQRSAEIAAAVCAMPRDPQRAALHARAALALSYCTDAWTGETADVWRVGYQALAAAGAHAEARACLRTRVEWVERAAREHVPAEFRASFLEDNPVNRALLEAARRELT